MSKPNWNAKGAALNDRSARQEYGPTQEEILSVVRDENCNTERTTFMEIHTCDCYGTKQKGWLPGCIDQIISTRKTANGIEAKQKSNPQFDDQNQGS